MSLFGIDAMIEGMAQDATELVEELRAEKAELLAALKAFVEEREAHYPDDVDADPKVSAARAAIAKAEGRSND